MAAVGNAQFARQTDQAVGAHDRRIETIEVDAGRDRFQPVLQRRKSLQCIARDMLRDGDHRIGARLTPLDETSQEIGGEERPVQGRDPFDAEPTRERARDPTRRGRARLDDVDLRIAQA